MERLHWQTVALHPFHVIPPVFIPQPPSGGTAAVFVLHELIYNKSDLLN